MGRDRRPCRRQRRADLAVLGQVGDETATVGGDERLERGAGAQRAVAAQRASGQRPVQQAVRCGGVLTEIDDPGDRVDDGCLVGEATEALQRRGVDVVGGFGRVDLEHEPVVLGEPLLAAGPELRLLAGQPRSPGCLAAGTVGDRAGHADVLGDDVAVAVELRGGRSAHTLGVVGDRWVTDDVELVVGGEPLLAVANEVASAVELEQSRTVEGVGQHAVGTGEWLSGLRHGAVAEALREVEHAVGIGHERSIARRPAAPTDKPTGCDHRSGRCEPRRRSGRTAHERRDAAREDHSDRGPAAAMEERRRVVVMGRG